MKLRNLTYLGGLAALALVTGTVATYTDIDATTDALAAGDTGALSLTCSAPTAAAFTPAIAYTLSITAPARGTVPNGSTHTVSGSLSNGVSSESSVATITTVNHATATKLHFYHTAPKMKLGGLQCSTSTGATLEAEGDASDSTDFEVGVGGIAATTYSSSYKIDSVNTGANNILFGGSGLVGTSAISDSSDSQGVNADGEVTFGAGSTTATGGFRLTNELKYLTVNPSVTETLSVTMTAS